MAELFGLGQQKPPRENPWETSARREREVEPFAQLLENAGNAPMAALTRANITPQEKSVLAKMLGGGGGTAAANPMMGNSVNLGEISNLLMSASTPQELQQGQADSIAKILSSGLPDAEQKKQIDAVKTIFNSRNPSLTQEAAIQQKKKEQQEKDAEVEAEIEDFYRRTLDLLEKAPKSAVVGNIRVPAIASPDPAIAEFLNMSKRLAGIESKAEGGQHTVGVQMMRQNYDDITKKMKSWLGVDHDSLIGTIRGALGAGSLSHIADKVDAERAAEKEAMGAKNNMMHSPLRPVWQSVREKAEEQGLPSFGLRVGDATMNTALDLLEGAAAVPRMIAEMGGVDTTDFHFPRIEADKTTERITQFEKLGLTWLFGGSILGKAGMAPKGKIMKAGAEALTGGIASWAAGAVGETGAKILTKKPTNEREEAFREDVGTSISLGLGGLMLNFSKSLGNIRAERATGNRARGRGGSPNGGGGGGGGKPPSGGSPKPKGYDPASESGSIYDVGTVQQGLSNIRNTANSARVMVQPLRNNDAFSTQDLDQVYQSLNLSQQVMMADMGQVVNAFPEPYRETYGSIVEANRSSWEIVNQRRNSVQELERTAAGISPNDVEAYQAAQEQLSIARAQYRNTLINYASSADATSSHVNAFTSAVTANPEASLQENAMTESLNRAIETGQPMPEWIQNANNFIVQNQENPTAVSVYSPKDTALMRQNLDETAEWQQQQQQAQEAATERERRRLQAEDRRLYDTQVRQTREYNQSVGDRNVEMINAALPEAHHIVNMGDSAQTLATEIDRLWNEESRPVGREIQAVERELDNYIVPVEDIGSISADLREAAADGRALVQSRVTNTMVDLLETIADRLQNRAEITLGDLSKAISEVGEITSQARHEGHSVNKLKNVDRLLRTAFDRVTERLSDTEEGLPELLQRRTAAKGRYRELKQKYENPEIARLRSNSGGNKEPPTLALGNSSEGLAKLSAIVGEQHPIYRGLVARNLREQLIPTARRGDMQGKNQVINELTSRQRNSVPATTARTLRAIRYARPRDIAPYVPNNYNGLVAPSNQWFKAPPKSVNVGDMTPEQLMAQLDTVSGIKKVKASTPDTPQRQALFGDKAVEVLSRGKIPKHASTWMEKHVEKFGIRLPKGNPVEIVLGWSDAMRDVKNASLVRELIGEKEFGELNQLIKSVEKDAKGVGNWASTERYLKSAAIASTASGFMGMHVAPLAFAVTGIAAFFAKRFKESAKTRLNKKGISAAQRKDTK